LSNAIDGGAMPFHVVRPGPGRGQEGRGASDWALLSSSETKWGEWEMQWWLYLFARHQRKSIALLGDFA
jgi:hypothetical protein